MICLFPLVELYLVFAVSQKIILLTSTGFGRMSIMIFSVLVFVILTGEWPTKSCHSTTSSTHRITDRCPRCRDAVENQLHLFLLCGFVKETIVEDLICSIIGKNIILTGNIFFFNLFPPEVKKELPLVLEIWSIFKHSVWLIRNRVKMERQRLLPKDLFFIVLGCLKFRFKVDTIRLPDVILAKYWNFPTVCTKRGDSWEFIFCPPSPFLQGHG